MMQHTTPVTSATVAALEQWARQRLDELGDLISPDTRAHWNTALALCAAWREGQQLVSEMRQAEDALHRTIHTLTEQRDAAVARAEQAERDKQTLAEVAAQHLKDRDAARAEVARLKSALANARAMAEMASETARDRQ